MAGQSVKKHPKGGDAPLERISVRVSSAERESDGIPSNQDDEIQDMETIGDRVRKLREAAGLDRQELADAVGMAKTTLATLEDNRQRSTTKLHRIAEVLGVNPAWLETGKGQKSMPASREREPLQSPPPSFSQESQSWRPNPTTMESALSLLAFDEEQAGRYSPQSRAERLCDIYARITADGGVRLSSESNRQFEREVWDRKGGANARPAERDRDQGSRGRN